jgi:hypothetical protein
MQSRIASRNSSLVHEKLKAPDCRWDVVVCDEADKMSATVFEGEIGGRRTEAVVGMATTL